MGLPKGFPALQARGERQRTYGVRKGLLRPKPLMQKGKRIYARWRGCFLLDHLKPPLSNRTKMLTFFFGYFHGSKLGKSAPSRATRRRRNETPSITAFASGPSTRGTSDVACGPVRSLVGSLHCG